MGEEDLKPAVFLDRDGTIIEDMEFSVDPAGFKPLPGAVEALRRLQEAGYVLVVVTNQSGVARGHFTEGGLRAFHDHMVDGFARLGVEIAGVYYCPHYEDGKIEKYAVRCDCRKPEPGMLLRAAAEHGIDLKRSWMVGDRSSDVGAGKAAGCRTIRVLTGAEPVAGGPDPTWTATDMGAAAEVILST